MYNATISKTKQNLSFMYENSKSLVKKINKSLDKENAIATATEISGKSQTQQSAIALLFLLLFNRFDGAGVVYKGATDLLDKNEADEKDKMIDNIIANARDNSMVFYLASEHEDCAKDHRDYQGKMYVDENWKSYTDSEEVQAYVQQHNVKTIQWVMGKPVWFITRPNCRHYVRQLETEEVLQHSAKSLINKYNMHRQVGQRGGMQTLRHPTKATWYKERANIEGIIAKYNERLAMHEQMYRQFKCDDLQKMIKKDKMLIKKWKTYLNEKFS